MKTVQILGPGCPKCKLLAVRMEEATKALGLDCRIEKVTDIDRIISYGVMMTPAVVVDGAVRLAGRVPSIEEAKALLTDPAPASDSCCG